MNKKYENLPVQPQNGNTVSAPIMSNSQGLAAKDLDNVLTKEDFKNLLLRLGYSEECITDKLRYQDFGQTNGVLLEAFPAAGYSKFAMLHQKLIEQNYLPSEIAFIAADPQGDVKLDSLLKNYNPKTQLLGESNSKLGQFLIQKNIRFNKEHIIKVVTSPQGHLNLRNMRQYAERLLSKSFTPEGIVTLAAHSNGVNNLKAAEGYFDAVRLLDLPSKDDAEIANRITKIIAKSAGESALKKFVAVYNKLKTKYADRDIQLAAENSAGTEALEKMEEAVDNLVISSNASNTNVRAAIAMCAATRVEPAAQIEKPASTNIETLATSPSSTNQQTTQAPKTANLPAYVATPNLALDYVQRMNGLFKQCLLKLGYTHEILTQRFDGCSFAEVFPIHARLTFIGVHHGLINKGFSHQEIASVAAYSSGHENLEALNNCYTPKGEFDTSKQPQLAAKLKQHNVMFSKQQLLEVVGQPDGYQYLERLFNFAGVLLDQQYPMSEIISLVKADKHGAVLRTASNHLYTKEIVDQWQTLAEYNNGLVDLFKTTLTQLGYSNEVLLQSRMLENYPLEASNDFIQLHHELTAKGFSHKEIANAAAYGSGDKNLRAVNDCINHAGCLIPNKLRDFSAVGNYVPNFSKQQLLEVVSQPDGYQHLQHFFDHTAKLIKKQYPENVIVALAKADKTGSLLQAASNHTFDSNAVEQWLKSGFYQSGKVNVSSLPTACQPASSSASLQQESCVQANGAGNQLTFIYGGQKRRIQDGASIGTSIEVAGSPKQRGSDNVGVSNPSFSATDSNPQSLATENTEDSSQVVSLDTAPPHKKSRTSDSDRPFNVNSVTSLQQDDDEESSDDEAFQLLVSDMLSKEQPTNGQHVPASVPDGTSSIDSHSKSSSTAAIAQAINIIPTRTTNTPATINTAVQQTVNKTQNYHRVNAQLASEHISGNGSLSPK